ncbi:MAG: hypothetical protein KDD47_27865 [Acidobacteria bacterium]|nr:hypothetical protein [Acidobacteriota bacterium]
MNPAAKRRKVAHRPAPGGGAPDVLFQNDPPTSFYALVLSIDEAVGAGGGDQLHTAFDAARVSWYQSFQPLNPPALDAVAVASRARLLDWISTPAQFDHLDQQLRALGHPLEEYSWWLISKWPWDFRAAVRLEQFRAHGAEADPSAVGRPTARHEPFFILPRLIVPRRVLQQVLFAIREYF